jgi:imidazolonepropionase-like amidohydrolase
MYAGFEAVIMNFPSSGKRGRWDKRSEEDVKKDYDKSVEKLNGIWAKAKDYARMDSIATAQRAAKTGYNPQMDALLPAARGEGKLMIRVNKKGDILNAIKWVGEHKIDAIFVSVAEGWRVADEIAKANIPVLVGPVLRTTSRKHDKYDRPYKNPAILSKAGVKMAIMTNEAENVRNLPFNAGFAAAYGLGVDEALKAVTINPAEIFGLGDQLGSIEKGKVANLFITDGDPFETKTQPKYLFINGWNVPIESRHTLLYDEFLERSPGLKDN